MSLLKFLKIREVQQKFKEIFRFPSFPPKKDMLVIPLTENYALVGGAFDYLLRFFIKYQYPEAIDRKWVAETSLELIQSVSRKYPKYIPLYKQARKVVENAKKVYQKYLKKGKITDKLLRTTILLDQVESYYRTRFKYPHTIGVIDNRDITDLRNLISIVSPTIFYPTRICRLNPIFGKASRLVRGADADLLIDDKIIEIKVSKYLRLFRDYFYQLLGYYTLYRIAYEENFIHQLGVYFARHGYLYLFKIRDVVRENEFLDFKSWFIDKAFEVYG